MSSEREGISVSVYIPTRNRSALLVRAVKSVLAQKHENVQLVIVDDCSDDETEELVRTLMDGNRTSKRIVYQRLPRPSGACAARNVAIDCADGELITGLDDDDYFISDRISALVDAFDPEKYAFVFDGYVRETIGYDGKSLHKVVALKKRATLARLLKRNVVGNQVLTLTDRVRKVGGFDEGLTAWQDYDLWIRLARRFGSGQPVGGASYHQTLDTRMPRISSDLDRIRAAAQVFRCKHPEYGDERLASFLKLSQACYGIRILTIRDLVNIAVMMEPYLLGSAVFFYLRNELVRP